MSPAREARLRARLDALDARLDRLWELDPEERGREIESMVREAVAVREAYRARARPVAP